MTNKFVLRDHLDITKGFIIDDSAKKIQVALSDELAYDESGKLKLADNTKAGVIETAELQGNKLKLTGKDGSVKEVDLSALTPTVDLHVSHAAVEGTTLKLTGEDDQPEVTVDLAEFAAITAQGTDTTTVEGDGTSANPLKVNVKLADEDNLLTNDNGLKVAKPDVELVDTFGQRIGFAFTDGKSA